ncbi:hypothetical protein B6B07_003905 [Salmonella enterica subsp. enterica serovar Berta]|nr:hypothetical protein [Salmonella enterica subsp. enterica serovar Berta]
MRRLQGRAGGRIIHSPLESEIKKALYNDDDLPLLKQIRSEINSERFLSYLHSVFNIDPSQYTVTFIKDGSPRFRAGTRNMNASDFLTKHMNLEWEEAKRILLDIWQDQKDNKYYPAIKSRVSLTPQQAKERFVYFNEYKKLVSAEIKKKHAQNILEYKSSLRSLLSIRDKREREVARGFIIFKKLEKESSINALRQECFYQINAHFNHWQPNKGNDMALGDVLKKIIKNPVEGNSISSGSAPEAYSISKRLQIQQSVDEYVKRELTDLVPHKVSPKEVRYLDPKSTQTVFIDKGEHIRISGEVTQDKTEAMMLYAKEKYGGVLKLNGSEEFKVACAMAAAEKAMNIILKPDQYHEMMQTRIAELQAEKTINQQNTLQPAEREMQPEAAKPESQVERPVEQENTVQKDVQTQPVKPDAEPVQVAEEENVATQPVSDQEVSPFEQKIKELEEHYQVDRTQFGTLDGEMITSAEVRAFEDGTYSITYTDDNTGKEVAGFHVSGEQLNEMTGKNIDELSADKDGVISVELSDVHLESEKIRTQQNIQEVSPFEQKIKELEEHYQIDRTQFGTLDGEMITSAEIRALEDGTYSITYTDDNTGKEIAGFHVSGEQLNEMTGKNIDELSADKDGVISVELSDVHLESEKIRTQQNIQEVSPFEQKIKELEEHYQVDRTQFGTLDGEMITSAEIRAFEDGTYDISYTNDDTGKQIAGFTVSDAQLKEITGKNFADMRMDEYEVIHINAVPGVHLESEKLRGQPKIKKDLQSEQTEKNNGGSVILTDDQGRIWDGSKFGAVSVDKATRFTPEEGLKQAFKLSVIHKTELEATPVEVYKLDEKTSEISRVIDTNQAQNWPHAETSYQKHFDIQLERESYLSWRDNSLGDLRDEAESLISQQQEAQRLLDEAEKNNFPQVEIGVLAKGVNAITARVQVVTEQLKQAEAELQQKSETLQAEQAKPERTLDGELNKLSENLAKELSIDKNIVRQSLEFAKFKDVADLDNCMNNAEMVQAIKNDIVTHMKDTEVERERNQSIDNERER